MVKIESPKEHQTFKLGQPITFSGTANGGVTQVSLISPSRGELIPLAVAPVQNGKWKFTQPFYDPGQRTVVAAGLDSAGDDFDDQQATRVFCRQTYLWKAVQGARSGNRHLRLPAPALFLTPSINQLFLGILDFLKSSHLKRAIVSAQPARETIENRLQLDPSIRLENSALLTGTEAQVTGPRALGMKGGIFKKDFLEWARLPGVLSNLQNT